MKLFISHAVKDEGIAHELLDMLRLASGIDKGDIFFSSYAGDIPNGRFFVEQILTKLNDADFVIALISPSYLDSKFCLEELGAAQMSNLAGSKQLFTLLIPPSNFRDLDAVLYGVQSGLILRGSIIDELLERIIVGLGKSVPVSTRNAERDKFLKNSEGLIRPIEAQELLKQIKILDVVFERVMDANTTYKMKLRVVFRNETPFDIVAQKPTWTRDADEVDVMPDLASNIQLEAGAGWEQNQWAGEVNPQNIRRHEVFRIWIGLNWNVTDDTFRRRHERLQVGTLHLPVIINGCNVTLIKKI